uniref:ShKT domain-containing protein n=1 Tax=Panagrolaimus superbus TaxID=310955 RepID=A0A914YL62_9BILA
MISKSICIFAAILPLAIYGSSLSVDENLISGEIDNDKLVRNRVAVGDKELSSAEALEFLSNLAKNASENKGPTKEGSLPILPPGGGGGMGGGEFGPVIPNTNGNNNGPINPFIPKEENKGPINPAEGTGDLPAKIKTEIENPNPSGRMRCQDDRTKLFISTAQACTDTRGTDLCKSLFAAPDLLTGRRDPKCDELGYEDIAKSCRKQCAICCEDMNFACEDDDSGLIDCQKNLNKCHVSKWFDVLSKYCAGTCGLCTKTSCRDTNADCRTMKGVCTNPEQKAIMQKQCARTCGFCIPGVTSNPIVTEIPAPPPSAVKPPPPSGGSGVGTNANCVDVGKNCSERANLCGHPLYMEYMKKLCPKTCNTCGAHIPLATACADTHPKCREWVDTGFCANQYYTREYKKKNCAKSCKLC